MEFKASKTAFLHAVSQIIGVIERTPARLILLNFKIIVQNGHVTIDGTDGKVFLRDSFEAETIRPGEITITARTLNDVLKVLPEGELHVSTDANNWVELAIERSKYRLPGLPAEEFPDMEPFPDQTPHTIGGEALSLMLTKTHFAISEDETRPVLCGLYVEHENHETSFVSTDGHRLSYALSKAFDFGDAFNFIIPKKVVRELRRILGEFEGNVEFVITETHQFYRIGSLVMVAKNIAGKYPNFRQVIPKDFTTNVRFKRSAMQGLLRRVMLIQSPQTQGMTLNVVEGIMRATAENPELGDVNDEFEVEYEGKSFTVCYNPRYFIEILSALESEYVSLNLGEVMGPGVILEDSDDNDPRLLYILMPMKLR